MNRLKFPYYILALVLVFLYAPLLVLCLYAVNASASTHWTGFSLRWFRELFGNSPELWTAFGNTLLVALSAGAVATVLGAAGAIGMRWSRFRFKGVIEGMAFLPMVTPEIIVGVSLLLLFANLGVPLSLFTVFLAHVSFCLPFTWLIVMARLEGFDGSLLEAARDLGAGEWQTLTRVLLPIAAPGILSAFLMAITLSMEDFVITFFVSGPGSSTLAVHIYGMMRLGVSPVINALSVILLAGTALLAFATRRVVVHLGSQKERI